MNVEIQHAGGVIEHRDWEPLRKSTGHLPEEQRANEAGVFWPDAMVTARDMHNPERGNMAVRLVGFNTDGGPIYREDKES